MILLIESDLHTREMILDLLPRERITGISSTIQALEMICKFQQRIKLIICNIHLLHEIVSRRTIFRLCLKLYIDIPPILGYYQEKDLKIKSDFEKEYREYRLIKYDEDDDNFPMIFINAVRELYPQVNADLEFAREIWLKKEATRQYVDPRQWLREEGFTEDAEKLDYAEKEKRVAGIIPIIKKDYIEVNRQKTEKEGDVDYKKLYFELKGRFDTLLEYVKELIDFVKRE
ncbi:MAG: hypothetical protein ABIL05_03275 [candidate division WOR-3 bacterium]